METLVGDLVGMVVGFMVVGFADVGLTVGLGVGCNSTMHCNHEKIKHLQFIPACTITKLGIGCYGVVK